MPKNNNLEPVTLPMDIRFGEKPTTCFQNNLHSIKVELVDAPTQDQLLNYLPNFVNATWADMPMQELTELEKVKSLRDVFTFKTLPTAMETIGLTFAISGISLQEVTHIIRYRKASFSAECSGDKWWDQKTALIPASIQLSNGKGGRCKSYDRPDSDNFHERYMRIVEESKKLYCDMIDSKDISIMDARMILPRCLETFYYMRMSLGDALHFIRQRIDKQIQPETDNIIAYQMYLQILKQFPFAFGLINIYAPSQHYIKTARTGKATNLYYPDEHSDTFEWNEKDFIYQKHRYELNGTDRDSEGNSYPNLFLELFKKYECLIHNEEIKGKALYEETVMSLTNQENAMK